MSISCHVAVLIPCYNEEITIWKVVNDFKHALPGADIYVYDNNSADNTKESARAAGAIVRDEHQQGKGNVVRRMFRDIDADFYIIVDGDDTYDANMAPRMVDLAQAGPYDLINCVRLESSEAAYRSGHRWGNVMLTSVVRQIFGDRVRDMLSGYKLFSRRFVKSFPVASGGFDIETEITIHALELAMPVAHVEGAYDGRPEGSESKLSTYRDGLVILWMIVTLFKHERPLQFFSWIAGILVVISLFLGGPVVVEFFHTGEVHRLPTAVLAMGIMLTAALSFMTALILDTVTRGRKENRMLAYLRYPILSGNTGKCDKTNEQKNP
jgi:glycosyltransferase involved in cell wall biosynthesis